MRSLCGRNTSTPKTTPHFPHTLTYNHFLIVSRGRRRRRFETTGHEDNIRNRRLEITLFISTSGNKNVEKQETESSANDSRGTPTFIYVSHVTASPDKGGWGHQTPAFRWPPFLIHLRNNISYTNSSSVQPGSRSRTGSVVTRTGSVVT